MSIIKNPGLFGINKSNRDFCNPETWGKNQFNSSFPAALCCYLFSKDLRAKYITVNETYSSVIKEISIDKIFGLNPLSENTYFSFETQFLPYQRYVIGNIPRNDLVIQNLSDNTITASLEIKLTALPDNSTCNFEEKDYGCEIVIRPDTIIYLACSILKLYENSFNDLYNIICSVGDKINNWTNASHIIPYLNEINDSIQKIVKNKANYQSPIILEPIWKTKGKTSKLANNCLDVFIWSNLAMLKLFLPPLHQEFDCITRHTRSMIWLFKMLYDFCKFDKFNGALIIDELSYNTKNDKAFSSSGIRTHDIMKCAELICPRIKKNEIKNIILGDGQNLLSPERRFDAIIYNSPDLFNEGKNECN